MTGELMYPWEDPSRMPGSPDDDLAVIAAFCRQASIAAVADLVRAQEAGYSPAPYQSIPVVVPSPAGPAYRTATTRPVEDDDYPRYRRTWWERNWLKTTVVGGILALVGVIVTAVVVTLGRTVAPTPGPHDATMTLVLVLIAALVGLWLLAKRRGGKTFDFHGTGRIH